MFKMQCDHYSASEGGGQVEPLGGGAGQDLQWGRFKDEISFREGLIQAF